MLGPPTSVIIFAAVVQAWTATGFNLPRTSLLGFQSIPVDLKPYYNNAGTRETERHLSSTSKSNDVAEGFDGRGRFYPSSLMPKGTCSLDGVSFEFPVEYVEEKPDNVKAESQIIPLPQHLTKELHFLVAGEGDDGQSSERIEVRFEDGRAVECQIDVKPFYSSHWTNSAPIMLPYHLSRSQQSIDLGSPVLDWNSTHIHHIILPLATINSPVISVQLPPPSTPNGLHIWAMSSVPYLLPEDLIDVDRIEGKGVKVTKMRGTLQWEEVSSSTLSSYEDFAAVSQTTFTTGLNSTLKAQVVQVTLSSFFPLALPPLDSTDSRWLSRPYEVTLRGATVLKPGRIERLMPGDETTVSLLVLGESGRISVDVIVSDGQAGGWIEEGWEVDLVDFNDHDGVIEGHEVSDWFDGAKFGIFIHWGIFSVPAWTDIGRYAEWYQYWMHNLALHHAGLVAGVHGAESDATMKYHLETYGANFLYDDFIPMFTGAKFNASEWTAVIEDSGAKYFVITTKHHDGYAIFDAKATSNRSSVSLEPHRDFLGELMKSAEEEHPSLKKGTYFSMPEWYNPDYGKYGWGDWTGIPPTNPYNESYIEPYAGHIPVDDFIADVQLEQMKILTQDYKTDIMWCDIGGANATHELMKEWSETSRREGRKVVINNRCGLKEGGDFETPELARYATVQRRKWESCEGIDPHSFGYQQRTNDEEYRSATEIISRIVDISSKNGNYLLNIGPDGEGKIIDAMKERLLEVGVWLKSNGRCIYNTVPFNVLPEFSSEGVDLRFTRTASSFCIISLLPPQGTTFRFPQTSLPLLPGDSMKFLSSKSENQLVDWRWNESGMLEIEAGDDALLEKHAWVFEIQF